MASKTRKSGDQESVVTMDLVTILTPLSIFIAGLLISVSIIVAGIMMSNGEGFTIKKNTGTTNDTADVPGTTDPVVPPTTEATVSIDDDPILGNRDAKVAIVEFSDYECPFCQRHWQQTYPSLVENFIDTGEVMLVFRDLPLSFHDPAATREAIAAECVREQSNDEKYFDFHDYIYENTPANGVGITNEKLGEFVDSMGLNGSAMIDCVKAEKYAEEVAADAAAATAAGINGTPGFVIGKIDGDGNVTGVVVSGAQSYATFESVILEQLGK